MSFFFKQEETLEMLYSTFFYRLKSWGHRLKNEKATYQTGENIANHISV